MVTPQSVVDVITSATACQYPKRAISGLLGYAWVIVFAAAAFAAFNSAALFAALERSVMVAFYILAVSFVLCSHIYSSVIASVSFLTECPHLWPVKLTSPQLHTRPALGAPVVWLSAPPRVYCALGGYNSTTLAPRALCARSVHTTLEVAMKANWLILALGVFALIACLLGEPKRSYDSVPSAAFDPTRSIRVVLMQPFYRAATALDATADW